MDHFQKGNVHTHSFLSDGTATFDDMVGWYRTHGYQFVAMTEHNVRIDPAELNVYAAPGFVVLPGEEVTNSATHAPLHVNSLCARTTVGGGTDYGAADLGLTLMFRQIRAAGGVPLVNHPNFHYALRAGDIASGASGPYLLEIASGHPDVHPEGNAVHPSAETIWDDVLARGAEAYPAAVDDAHGLEPARSDALPGKGWVETFGAETSVEAICAALAEGRLYASTGPEIARLVVKGDAIAVAVTDAGAKVEMVGEWGEVLRTASAGGAPEAAGLAGTREVSYRLTGEETLVRVRVTGADGKRAWTAAFRVVD